MKKKFLVTLLSLTMTAILVCGGCGNKTDQSMAADMNPTEVESTDPAEESENTDDSESATEPEESKEPEEETVTTPTPEPTQTPEAVSDEQESEEETEESKEVPHESAATTPAPEETTVPAPESAATETATEQAVSYTVTEMSATMYAQNAVNLRQGPGTEYAKVGNLTKGQQVTVTGQAGNGWYQLDNGAFVSNKYLGDAAPMQQVTGTTPTDPIAPRDPLGGIGESANTSYVANATDFFNYMNQQRSAAGLGTLTWDDGMAAVAQRRAKELATDYSHNGNVEMYGENIHNNTSGSYVDWYNSFYNSSAHRETMMTPNYGRGAAAVYFDGFKYYVVSNFAGTPLSTEQLIEQSQPGNLIPAGGNENGTTNSFSTTGETLDPNNPADADILDAIQKTQEQLNNGEIDRVYD